MPSWPLIGLDIAGLIHDVIEQGTRSGDFRLLDPDKATTFVGQQLYGAMSVRAGEPSPAPIDEAADEVCNFLLHGLAGPARGEVRSLSAGCSRSERARLGHGSTGQPGERQWSDASSP